MPLLMALCVVIGIVIGTFYANHFSGNRLNIINSGSNRLNNLLHIIDDQYVDTVNINDLVEKAIPQILSELDPHSAYISAKDAQNAADDLKGSFFGVGIEFTIREDTIHVQNVIADGPAERAGDARPRLALDHAGLHARVDRAAARRLREEPSAGLSGAAENSRLNLEKRRLFATM